MKIIVDTKEDSREQIVRAAKFLMTLVEGSQQEFKPEIKEGTFGMFDEKPKKKPFNINQIIEY